MVEKETLALSDKSIVPTEEVIFSIIGARKVFWKDILESITSKFKNVSYGWNYYNDGHQWLFKLVYKKKTIFWGAIVSTGEFRVTFYFGDKAEGAIRESSLSNDIINNFTMAQRFGKLRPISFHVNSPSDVDTVLKLTDIKINLK
jgi:hypothetical protein